MSIDCLFCDIISGSEPDRIISEDANQEFLLVEDAHPEGAIHWLAIPRKHVESTEAMEIEQPEQLLRLVQFAITQTKQQMEKYPILANGFTIKFHFGPYETIPHAKLHVVSTE